MGCGVARFRSYAAPTPQLRNRATPQLRPRRWVDGRREDGSFGVLWLTPTGKEMTQEDWKFPHGRFLSYVLGPLQAGQQPIFIVLNSAPEAIEFTLPTIPDHNTWTMILNTALGAQLGQNMPAGWKSQAPGRSVLVYSGSK